MVVVKSQDTRMDFINFWNWRTRLSLELGPTHNSDLFNFRNYTSLLHSSGMVPASSVMLSHCFDHI